jgi:hypothetical protein
MNYIKEHHPRFEDVHRLVRLLHIVVPKLRDVHIMQMLEVAQGLEYLHSQHLAHGDLRGVGIILCLIHSDIDSC